MDSRKWLQTHVGSLSGHTAAITGPTGGIGREICRGILALSGNLILIARDPRKAQDLIRDLKEEYPRAGITFLQGDLTSLADLDRLAGALTALEPDLLIHNAGAYQIPRFPCSSGLENVFTINFAAPYYLTARLLPMLERKQGKVVVMGSVAHTYSPTDEQDWDFSGRKPIHLVYGNSKRYLMFGFRDLLQPWPHVDFAVAHPGITVTNITNHYPKWLYAIIRRPMQILFMKPAAAARPLLAALTHPVPQGSWIGPRFFSLWGSPAVRSLHTCPQAEQDAICRRARAIYDSMVRRSEAL